MFNSINATIFYRGLRECTCCGKLSDYAVSHSLHVHRVPSTIVLPMTLERMFDLMSTSRCVCLLLCVPPLPSTPMMNYEALCTHVFNKITIAAYRLEGYAREIYGSTVLSLSRSLFLSAYL